MIVLIRRLHWEQLDPARHPFDPEAARRVAEPIVRALAAEVPPVQWKAEGDPRQDRCERDLDLGLLDAYGAWMAGWNWAKSEPGGGGPVGAWCCARDSVLRKGEPAEETVARVVRAVCEWRGFLEELAAMQTVLRGETAGLSPEEALERAAARYAGFVLARTGAEDAWYGTFTTVLRWHLESGGCDDERVAQAIRAAVSGRFKSWIEPQPSVVTDVAAEIALRVPAALAEPRAVEDALDAWLAQREKPRRFDWPDEPRPAESDGHRAYIDRRDAARSPERARRMHAALDVVRAAALAGRPLTWELLRDAVQRALGDPGADFRRGEAIAHDGRERYGLGSDTRARFERCLAEANGETGAKAVERATMAYLDVCFFHPFEDGNARAARLALDYVLTRGGLALRTAEPAFLLPRSARDPDGAWMFAYVLHQLVGTRRAGMR